MKRVSIELDSSGFRELLLSDAVADLVEQKAEQVASAAERNSSIGARFVVKGPRQGGYGGGRMIAYVAADNGAALRSATDKNSLERAVWDVAED